MAHFGRTLLLLSFVCGCSSSSPTSSSHGGGGGTGIGGTAGDGGTHAGGTTSGGTTGDGGAHAGGMTGDAGAGGGGVDCPSGYAGKDCDECAKGYHLSGEDCIVDEPTACQASSPSDEHYVDPQLGFDDPNYGGGEGACAFRTIEYAVSQATGKIRLAGKTHPITTTIYLSEGQELECDPDDPGVLSGHPLHTTSHVILRMNPNTALRHCMVRGENTAPGYCIQGDGPTTIEGNQIDKCGGASMTLKGTGHSIVGNQFLHSKAGVFFQTGGSADISDNIFYGAEPNVNCSQATTITGSGNSHSTGTVTCSDPCGCPEDFSQ